MHHSFALAMSHFSSMFAKLVLFHPCQLCQPFPVVPCFKLGDSLFSGGGASEGTSLASLSSQPGRHVSHRRVGSATALSDCGVVIHHCVFCTCSFHHDKVMIILMYCTKPMPNKHRQTLAKGMHIVWTGSCIGKLGKVGWAD